MLKEGPIIILNTFANDNKRTANYTFDSGYRSLNEHVVSQVVVESVITLRPGGYAGGGAVLSSPLKVVVLWTVVVPTETILKRALSRIGVVVHWKEKMFSLGLNIKANREIDCLYL